MDLHQPIQEDVVIVFYRNAGILSDFLLLGKINQLP